MSSRRGGGGIETWNRGAEELYGFTSDEARGRTPRELLQTVFLTPLERIEAALREQGRWEGEIEHRTRDGRSVTVSAKMQLDGFEVARTMRRDQELRPSRWWPSAATRRRRTSRARGRPGSTSTSRSRRISRSSGG